MMETDSGKKKRKWLIVLAVFLGTATLGLGVGAGHTVARYFLPESVINFGTVEVQNITTVRVNPLVVPINPQDPNFVDVIPLVKDAVVSIQVTSAVARPFGGRQELPGAGSGFIFAEDEDYVYIATNNHVIENTNTIRISLDDNESIPARVIGSDEESDLAVLAANRAELLEKGIPFTIAAFGNSDLMRMGDAVIAIGNAMGEGQIVTKGIVSAININIDVPDQGRRILNLNVMQTDAAVNRGNSGGPLINLNGEVIGIVTAKLLGADIEGMGYALPSNNIYGLIMDLKEVGSIRAPFVGIDFYEFNERVSRSFNMPSPGILVTDVLAGSPAETAGILVGDFIVAFNEYEIRSAEDYYDSLNASRAGEEIILSFFRDGERMEISVVLGSALR